MPMPAAPHSCSSRDPEQCARKKANARQKNEKRMRKHLDISTNFLAFLQSSGRTWLTPTVRMVCQPSMALQVRSCCSSSSKTLSLTCHRDMQGFETVGHKAAHKRCALLESYRIQLAKSMQHALHRPYLRDSATLRNTLTD